MNTTFLQRQVNDYKMLLATIFSYIYITAIDIISLTVSIVLILHSSFLTDTYIVNSWLYFYIILLYNLPSSRVNAARKCIIASLILSSILDDLCRFCRIMFSIFMSTHIYAASIFEDMFILLYFER